MANVLDLIGRIFISALFLISAYNKIFNLEGSMGWMEGFGIPGFLIFPAIAVEIILPVLVIVGYQARIAAGILAIFCLMTAFLFHFDFSDQSQLISFLKNTAIMGGLLIIISNKPQMCSVDYYLESKKGN